MTLPTCSDLDLGANDEEWRWNANPPFLHVVVNRRFAGRRFQGPGFFMAHASVSM